MSNSARKVDRLFQSAQAVRLKTIAAGVRAWSWLRLRAQKNERIRATFAHATGPARRALRGRIVLANRTLAGILGQPQTSIRPRAASAPIPQPHAARNTATRPYDEVVAQAMAEMLARVHAEQQAIRRDSRFLDIERRIPDRADAALMRPEAAFVSGAVQPVSPTAPAPEQSSRLPEPTSPHGFVDTRPLVATRSRPPGGVRRLRHGVLAPVRRPLVTDPQCRGAGRADDGLDESETRASAAQRDAGRSDRTLKLHHSSRKARASRR